MLFTSFAITVHIGGFFALPLRILLLILMRGLKLLVQVEVHLQLSKLDRTHGWRAALATPWYLMLMPCYPARDIQNVIAVFLVLLLLIFDLA